MSIKNEYGLTPAQDIFCHRVAAGRPQSDAYREAYPTSLKWKPESVHQKASVLAADDKVQSRIRAIQKLAADQALLDIVQIATQVRRLLMADIGNIVDRDTGRIKMPHEIDTETRMAVASFKFGKDGIEYKFWPKHTALDMAAKMTGMYEKDNKQKAAGMADLLEALSGNVVGPVSGPLPDDDLGDED